MLIDPRSKTNRGHSWRQSLPMSRRGLRHEVVGGAEIVLTARLPQQFLRRVDLPLAAPHRGIDSAPRQKLLMGPALGNDALVEHQNLVGVDHRRQAMCNHDCRASAGDALERRLNIALSEAVE